METRVLEQNRVVLVDSGRFRDIRDQLLQDQILTMNEVEIIEAENTSHKQMSTLLDILLGKPVEYERRFLKSLQVADPILHDQLDLSGEKWKGDVCRVADHLPEGDQTIADGNNQRDSAQTTTRTNIPTHSCSSTQPTEEISTTAPLLKFTESDRHDVTIEEDGQMVQDKPEKTACYISLLTDGLITGTQYWEVEVNWILSHPPRCPDDCWSVCAAGVRQEGSDFGPAPGADHLSYGVRIRYQGSTNSYRFHFMHKEKDEFVSTQQVLRDKTASHRLGFLYHPSERTLAVVDKETDTRLHTFRGLDVSRPFVPVVWIGHPFFNKTIRLLPVDQSSPLGHFFIS